MLDPAVLGTLRIGLDAIAAKASDNRPRPSWWPRTSIRAALAASLRRLAAALDRPSLGEVAG
jgi:hypothetical protein